jgi:isovaleryl-CoA dehydrogenase
MDNEEWWPAEAFARLGQQGYLGITIPQAYGGAGLDLVSTGLVAQAFSRWNHAFGLSWIAHDNLCANNLYRHGTEAQRRATCRDCAAASWWARWRSPSREPAPMRSARCA